MQHIQCWSIILVANTRCMSIIKYMNTVYLCYYTHTYRISIYVCWLWLLVWLWFVAPWLTLKLEWEPLTQLLVGDIGEEEGLGGVGWFRLLFVIWLWMWVWVWVWVCVVEGTVGACWWKACEERLVLDR